MAEFGIVTADGRTGLKYRTLHKQACRLEAALRGRADTGGAHDVRWLERQMIAASVPTASAAPSRPPR